MVWRVCTELINSTSFPGEVDGPLAGLFSSEDMGGREISLENLVGCQICPKLGLDSNGDRTSLKVSTGERLSVAEF